MALAGVVVPVALGETHGPRAAACSGAAVTRRPPAQHRPQHPAGVRRRVTRTTSSGVPAATIQPAGLARLPGPGR